MASRKEVEMSKQREKSEELKKSRKSGRKPVEMSKYAQKVALRRKKCKELGIAEVPWPLIEDQR
ncbi:hypothetical protein ES705_36795 [subsurface metagenome]